MIRVTREGDTLDLLAHLGLGRVSGAVEALAEANPGLVAAGPVLPAGLSITWPAIAIARPAGRAVRALWD